MLQIVSNICTERLACPNRLDLPPTVASSIPTVELVAGIFASCFMCVVGKEQLREGGADLHIDCM
jgi:hypothetical protein